MPRSKTPNQRSPKPFGQKRTPELMEKVLVELRKGKTPAEAAMSIGVDRTTIFGWRAQFPEWKTKWFDAVEQGVDLLEAEARRRAVEGYYKDIYYKGEPVGQEIQYSDMLLGLMLKGRRPEVYRERHEITGADGGPVETKTEVVVTFVKAVNGKPAE